MTAQEMQATIDQLRAENALLHSAKGRGLSLKVSEKGGVSLYGIGRFPATFYESQWRSICAYAPKIVAFLDVHASELKPHA